MPTLSWRRFLAHLQLPYDDPLKAAGCCERHNSIRPTEDQFLKIASASLHCLASALKSTHFVGKGATVSILGQNAPKPCKPGNKVFAKAQRPVNIFSLWNEHCAAMYVPPMEPKRLSTSSSWAAARLAQSWPRD
jgi:hypothetical protein